MGGEPPNYSLKKKSNKGNIYTKNMGLNLKEIREKIAEQNSNRGGGDGDSPFLKLGEDESIKIRFLQEIDEASKSYDDRRGSMVVVNEHVPPGQENFKRRAVCTMETDNRCWACEQTRLPEIGKKWRAKMRFYVNVIARQEGGDQVKILAQGFSDAHIGQSLVMIYEEFESLGAMDCKLTKTGAKLDTKYTILPLAPKAMSKNDEAHEVIDIEKFIKRVPYEQQQAYYTGADSSGGPSDWLKN